MQMRLQLVLQKWAGLSGCLLGSLSPLLIFPVLIGIPLYCFILSIAFIEMISTLPPFSFADNPYYQTLPPEHRLSQMLNALSQKAGIPPPRLLIAPNDINEFLLDATSRSWPYSATIILHEEATMLSDDKTLRALLAHELSHIQSKDYLLTRFISLCLKTTEWYAGLAPLLCLFTFSPWPLLFIPIYSVSKWVHQCFYGRACEFLADHHAAYLTADPHAVAYFPYNIFAYEARHQNRVIINDDIQTYEIEANIGDISGEDYEHLYRQRRAPKPYLLFYYTPVPSPQTRKETIMAAFPEQRASRPSQ